MSRGRTNRDGSVRSAWPDGAGRHHVSPLQASVVYRADDPDQLDDLYEGRAKGYSYAREGHPNADVLAGMIDDLEGRPGGTITCSGMSAVLTALLSVLRAGDRLIAGDQLYGRTLRLLREELPRFGIATDFVDASEAANVEAAMTADTRAILIEVVSNPRLRIADVGGIARVARRRGAKLIIDNTFTTPLGFSPWQKGADIVVHSVTKLLSGHSDVTLGYVAGRDDALNARFREQATTFGLTASPFDCWLAERGILTFGLRFRAAAESAALLEAALSAEPGVAEVIYPARSDHPDAANAASLTSGCNMVGFRIDGGRDAANRFVRAAAPLAFAPTLGDVSTTISHPATSSHRALTPQARQALGIDEGFFRVSVGIEDADHIIGCILRGIAAARG